MGGASVVSFASWLQEDAAMTSTKQAAVGSWIRFIDRESNACEADGTPVWDGLLKMPLMDLVV